MLPCPNVDTRRSCSFKSSSRLHLVKENISFVRDLRAGSVWLVDIFFSESLNEPVLVFPVHFLLLALPQPLYLLVRTRHHAPRKSRGCTLTYVHPTCESTKVATSRGGRERERYLEIVRAMAECEEPKAAAVDVVEIRGDVEEDFENEPQSPITDHVSKSATSPPCQGDKTLAKTETTTSQTSPSSMPDAAELERHSKRSGAESLATKTPGVKIVESLPPVPYGRFRSEALHLYGVDDMSTEDVLELFSLYGPGNVEWINDKSCEMVLVSCDCHVTLSAGVQVTWRGRTRSRLGEH